MRRKITALVLALCVLMSGLALNAYAADSGSEKLSLKRARYLAVFSLSVSAPVNVEPYGLVKLGSDFELGEGLCLFDPNGAVSHWCFPFNSTAVEGLHGYITVALNSGEPIISETVYGDIPYNAGTVFISPGVYFIRGAAGQYVDARGNNASMQNIIVAQADYKRSLADRSIAEKVFALNEQLTDALKKTTILGFLNGFDREALDYLLEYYFGSVYIFGKDNASANRDVEHYIKEATGGVYTVTKSANVDKTYMKPHPQSYYRESGSYDGICGKAAVMMMLSYYRDALGYDALPDDETMYAELSEIYDDIDREFAFVFDSSLVKEKFGVNGSYEIYAFLDAGLARYLNSKGYKQLALNVINNMTFSVPFVSNAVQALSVKDLRSRVADMIFDKTDGELNLVSGLDVSATDVVTRSLKRGEPAVIGSIWALNCDTYSNHYFAAVGYYELKYEFKLWGIVPMGSITKEYVEIYDTWSRSYTSIMDWSVFSTTSMYSANSLAALY